MANTVNVHVSSQTPQFLETNESLNSASIRVGEPPPGRVDGSVVSSVGRLADVSKSDFVEYWQQHLAAVTPTNFPLRHTSSVIADSSVLRTISVAHQSIGHDHGIKLPTLVTLAYALVLSAHSGSRNEVVFGYVLREQCVDIPDGEHKVGAYITTLPFNIAFDWDRTTLGVLLALQDELAQINHHSVALRGTSFSNAASCFRTILDLSPSNDECDIHTFGADRTGHDLVFMVKNNNVEQIQVEARFSSASISKADVDTFLDHLGTAFESILHELTSHLLEVNLMGWDEKQRSVVSSNSPSTLSGRVKSITELIEGQARETPQKIALQFLQEQFVTYHQMDSLANNLAHKLVAHGVRRGDFVGIYMDKSVEMFISILATHKAGGAYVPLDPENPPDRTRTILGLAESKIVLTSDDLQHQFNNAVLGADITSLVVDVHKLSPSSKPDVEPIGRDDVCHVLFTSGSTGTPKGVILSHGAVVESVFGSREVFGARDDRVLQFSNYTFDFSVWDWGATLSAGGTLCIAPKGQLLDDLAGVMRAFDVTFLETTPTVVSLIKPQDVPSLEILTVSGERMTLNVRETWAGEVRLFNTYGPTEASTCVLAKKDVTSQTDLDDLGHPFGVNSVYVLDELRRPVPRGCVGELYISGPQVALGYLKNQEQTAKSFTGNPFQPGTVMYASGDLVRMSPIDGSITYLGRCDTQIKIRGLRVELGEIEEVLKASNDAVVNAVVIKVDIVREALIAFIECRSGTHDPDITIIRDDSVGPLSVYLRQAVRQKLPTYMAPATYVFLDRLPLTTSGKLNRNALQAYFFSHEKEIREFELHNEVGSEASDLGRTRETEFHASIRSLWASILRLRPGSFGIDDDFYTVGGDSISAIRLASAARGAGIQLVATDIIEHPTIRAMARISQSATVNHDFDDDDVPSVTLEQMVPSDLTLMNLDGKGLDALRYDLLPKHRLSPSDVLDVFPCTAMQSSYLLAGLSVDAAYIVRQAYDLPAGTDAIKIQEAFEEFINHPNGADLRTVYVFDPSTDRFIQVVMRPGWKPMQWTTVVVMDHSDLDMAIAEYQDGCGSRNFEDGELLTRACIFEVNGVPLALAWSLHHGLADHWTMDNMEIDIGDIYAGRPLPLRRSIKPMIKYLEGLDRSVGLDFWRTHLLNAAPTPFLQALPGVPRAIVNMSISREVNTEHSLLTEHFGIMPSSLVTAAWSVVLAAHSGTADVVFGQIIAGRNAPIRDIDTMTGHFINTLARRVILNPKASVLDTLRHIQFEQIEISKHDHIALGDLMLQGIPVPSLIRSLLNFTNLPVNQDRLAGGQATTSHDLLRNRRPGGLDGQDLPFTLTVTPLSNESMCLEVNYIREAISQQDVDVILDHLESALRFLTTRLHDEVGDIDLISDTEKGRLLADISRGNALNSYQNISQLIEEQVRRTPKKIALQFNEDVFVTYQDMDTLSNDLASRLITNGVKRGALVALYMDKSIEMFLSILATHKAGGAYVPLDPEYPAERIRTIVGLAEVTLVLATRGLHKHLVSILSETGIACVLVDFNQLSSAAKLDVRPADRDDICHVLFTSGSTGTPKGVVLTHGSIIESVVASREVIGTLDGRVLQFSNYTFDVSVWDWGVTLSSGGRLCIAPTQQLMDKLGEVALNLDVTFLETTPSVAALVNPEQIPSLQMLVLGGESLTREVLDKWADAVTLVNAYGVTEASTNVTALNGVTAATACSNIGHPFGLNTVYILDDRLRLVPLGCVGELFIGGPQLARGYLNDPDQSAKVFIDNPFRPGTTIYATGDLVRMNAVDGSLTFLGRRDTQIKIHGLRVEVGEIEEVLKAASEIVTNAVVIKVDIGRECLVAFLECSSTEESQDRDIIIIPSGSLGSLFASLRHAVRQKLPSYMAPSSYVAVNRIPLTTSGKLDRKALSQFFMLHQQAIREMEVTPGAIGPHAVPRTEIQALIRSLWASVLKVDEGSLGIDDDFYMSGGDSLSAIRISSAARAAGLHLLVSDVVRNPSIRAMASIVAHPTDIQHIDLDETDLPGVTLEHMCPTDLKLLKLNQEGLDSLRNDLLPKHGLSASDVLDVYPSTSLQTSMLMAGLQVHDAYMTNTAYDLPHDTNVIRLKQAFEYFINHPNGTMLRTLFVFASSSNRFLQVLIRPGAKQMEWNTISVADDAELEVAIEDYMQGHGSRSFADGELMTRVCVFEHNGFARALVWTVHHVLRDGWTQYGHLVDIQNLYAHRSLCIRRSFKQLINYLENLDRAAGLGFWQKKLLTAVPTPFLQPPPGSPHVLANASSTRRIQTSRIQLAREFGIMASTLATAAWALVLAVHTGSLDVVFGHVLAGRSAPIAGIEYLVGLCINTVARRVVLDSGASIIDTLRDIQADQINITKHEYITFHDIQSRGIPVAGLFSSLFSFQNLPGDQQLYDNSDDRLLRPRAGGIDTVELPWTLTVTPCSPDNFILDVSYRREAISAVEVEVILDHYEMALSFMACHPHAKVRDIDFITPNEKRLLLGELRPSHMLETLLSPAQNVSELIEAQVRRTPHRIALQFSQDVFMTYREMDSLSNDLAHKLIKKGVKCETLVALCMDKSIEMFLSILATHKAGGGYVPLDPEYPTERIRAIIDLAQVTVVLTTRELYEQLMSVLSGTGIACMLVDFNQLSSVAKPDVGPAGRSDICHVLFTSGSTGIPKGVILTHGSIVESLVASREVIGALDGRILQLANYTFDITVWDWGATLTAGGTLCIMPKQQLMDNLGEVAASMDVTFLFTTPTVAALMTPEQVPCLQTLALGGEALKSDVRNNWAEAVTVIHAYGPTEASTSVVALKDVTPSTPCSDIGYPFGLNTVYILDERRRLVPLGCVGELFIGGPQLAQGYLNDPQQTGKVFVDDPFCPGTTIYATGDLVRMNPVDCALTFLGRRDTQIKIRGLRVEVGEIEAMLKAASDIPTNAVVVKVDMGRECLVAFLECPSAKEVGDMVMIQHNSLGSVISSLRYAVRQKLPSYMAPAYYVALNRLPLTSSGKMDRKALVQYFHSHEKSILHFGDSVLQQDAMDPHARPRTELQLIIRSLWSSVLGCQESSLGLDDDFYAVGGDSISAIYIANAARTAGLQLLATDIIRNPTLRAMANIAESSVTYHEFDDDDGIPSITLDHMSPRDLTLLTLDQYTLDSLRDELLPKHGISASDVLDIYPATTLQTSLLIAGLLVQDAYIISQSWNLPSGTDSTRLRRAFEDFIDHPNGMMFRTVFVFEPSSSRWLQVLLKPGAKRMKWETIVVTDEAQLELCIARYEESRTLDGFDDGELLTRACVLELNGFARVLVWSLHHALTDHWTIDGILFDIESTFARRPLASRRSFKPMVKYLERLDRTIGLDFWRRHLQGAIPTPFLQSIPGAPRVTTNMSVQREVHIDHSSLTRQFGITASTLVTCAWSVVLAAHSNCADVVFGQVLAGRSIPIKDVDSMTGVTINTVARRVILDENAIVIETLRQVQSDQIEISKHEHIALTDLQSQGIPVSDLFTTLLNFRNFRGPSAQDFSAGDRLFLNHRGARESVDFPFALTVDASSSDGLALFVNFASETISEAEVQAMLDHFEAALLFFIHHPHESMTLVNLVNSCETQRLLPSVKPDNPPCSEHSLLDLIEAQASRTPLKIALQLTQEAYMTYKQMDGLANGLAHILLASGINRGDLIGLYLDKSLETFISILATHKAGAAYVPLDPDNPPHRIWTILGLAGSKIVLTSKDLQHQFNNAVLGADITSLVLDVHELSPSSKPDVGPIGRDDVSHVLFTSGSTGTPKGVVLSHGAVVQSVLGSREVIGARCDRVLQFSNYTFDFSVWDWGVTLSTGGTLCIAPKRLLLDNLAGVLRDFDITFLEATPTVISLISPEDVPSLAVLVSGGERMTARVQSTWAEHVHLVNVYGPTEATVCVIAKNRLTVKTELDDLGRPFGANSIYVLDGRRRLVPLGCVGELCISGPQVAVGYLNSPEQTAKAFIDNPFQPGSVMYTTGDLVRMSPIDNSIIYLGRLDTQIKIRGLRVEPGEIEEVLKASNAAVVNAVVVKVDIGHEALIAFIECYSGAHDPNITIIRDDNLVTLSASLRQAVRHKLPTYMAPAAYVFLNRFPVTTSGKLDRNELHAFFVSHEKEIRDIERRLESHATVQKKRTRAETRIMRLWQQVLGIKEDIDIDDTFVSMGGDSVGLMRLGALAHKRGILLSVTDQLHNQTIREQAKFVNKHGT